jgi:hypothetical protein
MSSILYTGTDERADAAASAGGIRFDRSMD